MMVILLAIINCVISVAVTCSSTSHAMTERVPGLNKLFSSMTYTLTSTWLEYFMLKKVTAEVFSNKSTLRNNYVIYSNLPFCIETQ